MANLEGRPCFESSVPFGFGFFFLSASDWLLTDGSNKTYFPVQAASYIRSYKVKRYVPKCHTETYKLPPGKQWFLHLTLCVLSEKSVRNFPVLPTCTLKNIIVIKSHPVKWSSTFCPKVLYLKKQSREVTVVAAGQIMLWQNNTSSESIAYSLLHAFCLTRQKIYPSFLCAQSALCLPAAVLEVVYIQFALFINTNCEWLEV